MDIWKKCNYCYEGYYNSGKICAECNGTSKILISKLSFHDEINRLHSELEKAKKRISELEAIIDFDKR